VRGKSKLLTPSRGSGDKVAQVVRMEKVERARIMEREREEEYLG
jgi:hypothetical protein